MIYKYLPIFLLLTPQCTDGKNYTDSAETATEIVIATNITNLKMANLTAIPPRYSGNGSSSVHFFYGIELGYASATTKSAGTSTTGGGFMYKVELGTKIELHSRNQNKSNFLSISLCGFAFNINEKYKDALGNSESDKRSYGIAALPLSFTSMSYGRGGEGVGFYWQAGVSTDYIAQVKDNDNSVTNQYNSIYIEPFLSAGMSLHFEMRNVRTHQNLGGGRVLIGPYLGYAATNMAKESGVTMNGYTIGVRWTYIYF